MLLPRRNLDLGVNQITSLAGVAFDFLKCDVWIEDIPGGCPVTPVAYPLLNLAKNQITSLKNAIFRGSIG